MHASVTTGPVRRLAHLAAALLLTAAGAALADEPPIEIGSRLELMVDDRLIDSLTGDVRRTLHHPIMRDVALVHDEPWEGSGSGYHTIFRDGDRYRMYYRGAQYDIVGGQLVEGHPPVVCYAQSADGLRWTKPNLGLFEFAGTKENNIVRAGGRATHNFAPFKDARPGVPEDQRYKALAYADRGKGLAAYVSPDGLRWRLLREEPVLTDGKFDSLNLAFWDVSRGEYRAYYRETRKGYRGIRTATSRNFLDWTGGEWLEFPGALREHLYTNQVQPYDRAPHLLIGLPMRYKERRWPDSLRTTLPDAEHRDLRSSVRQRYGDAVTDTVLMTSRDGVRFDRWDEAFIRPGPERPGTWNYGHLGAAAGLVETSPPVEGMPNELSAYVMEDHWTGSGCRLRRYALRVDGFASVRAGLPGGDLRTKPLIFAGDELLLNYATSAAGSVRVAIHDADDEPIGGFGLNDCEPLFGDTLERAVAWKSGADLSELAGRPVRVRFELGDADLYSLRFR